MSAQAAAVFPSVDVIPQRPPFRYIDAIADAEPGQWAQARFKVRPDDPVFEGHFPGRPVFPGVLMIEAMAQTACWVMLAQTKGAEAERPPGPSEAIYVLVRVEQCEFRRMVEPGETLEPRAQLERSVGEFSFFHCTLSSGGQPVAQARLLVARRSSLSAS